MLFAEANYDSFEIALMRSLVVTKRSPSTRANLFLTRILPSSLSVVPLLTCLIEKNGTIVPIPSPGFTLYLTSFSRIIALVTAPRTLPSVLFTGYWA